MYEEIKVRLNSVNTCYHFAQSSLSSHLLSKKINTKLHTTIMLPVVLYGYKAWPFTLREGWWLKVFKKKMQQIFWHKRE
jgi:hypothetical protein